MTIKIQTILHSGATRPLDNWAKEVRKGYVKRSDDDDVSDKVIDIFGCSENVCITTPKTLGDSLGIKLNWLCFIFKCLGKQFMIGVQVLDSQGMSRLFRFDSECIRCKVTSIFVTMPLIVRIGWNCLEVDLKKQLQNLYGTDFVEVVRIKVHGTCRLRKIYAAATSLADEQIPYDHKVLQ